jgi:hypothetical protein
MLLIVLSAFRLGPLAVFMPVMAGVWNDADGIGWETRFIGDMLLLFIPVIWVFIPVI